MLAEPRRKKAWVLNPRKSQWADDESKFGQKMLEQMGWSKGKGLGRSLDGITDHIRPSVQNDSRGLGYEGRNNDWVAHLDDFNDLLANLQQGKEKTDKEDAPKTIVKSLEERSKKSRARVHYHKFTRGKDLSRYSSQDLASILGGRSGGGVASQPVTPVSSRPPTPPPHAESEPTSEAETETPAAPTPEVDASTGYMTISTGLSVKDYFAAKMRKMKMLKIKHAQEHQDTTPANEEPRYDATEDAAFQPSEAAATAGQEETKSKKKKKNKRPASPVEEVLPSVPDEENVASEEPKKKKKKTASSGEDVLPSVSEVENVNSEEPKKKKRKKRKNADSSPEEDKNAAEESPEMPAAEVCSAEASNPAADSSEQAPSDETGDVSGKKKKRKKSKSKRREDSD